MYLRYVYSRYTFQYKGCIAYHVRRTGFIVLNTGTHTGYMSLRRESHAPYRTLCFACCAHMCKGLSERVGGLNFEVERGVSSKREGVEPEG